MIYPDSIEHKIGFDTVRSQVNELCKSQQGRELCDAMSMSSDFESVCRHLGETDEALSIILSGEAPSTDGIHDLRAMLDRASIEGMYISAADFALMRTTLMTMDDIARYFTESNKDGQTPYPHLCAIAAKLASFPFIIKELDRIIDRWGNVKDNASPELAQCRKTIASMNGTINSIMRKVLSRAVNEGIVDSDTTPSVRDGRLVIPVAPMNKRKIAGIVHDESASGKTYFIEPAEVVEANNRLRELEIEEKRLVVKVLLATTEFIRPYINDIRESVATLARFDFIFAKAKFAQANHCAKPQLTDRCVAEWHDAFHPVLRHALERQSKKVVPLDIRITEADRIIVISGPNAGGKSVALKTVGITQYMLQCGMLAPLSPDSTMGIVENLMVDIGDDQSLEDDLSTYSSHLRNMKVLLQRGNKRTLALIDEFGSGTEPQIGGAIAQALLQQFNKKKMRAVITTHFRNLKQFADETPGLINGSMLYDRHLMQPMFKLSLGNPGSSFAIEIARKTGLPNEIIEAAEQIVGSDYINSDKYLLDINRDKRYWENKRESIKEKEKKLEALVERYESDSEELKRQRRQIIDDAKKEALAIIEGSNAAIERTIHDIRRSQAEREKTLEARRRLQDERERLKKESATSDRPDKKQRSQKTSKTSVPKPSAEPLAVGDNVLLEGSNTVGTITAIDGKKATVVFGNLTTTTDIKRLQRTIRKPATAKSANKADSYISRATTDEMRNRQLNFKTEIDLRGMRVDEALQAVTYFIDDAVQFDIKLVRILHGTGTGALRQAIRDYLESVPSVRSYHDEDVRFGGAGITVVEF